MGESYWNDYSVCPSPTSHPCPHHVPPGVPCCPHPWLWVTYCLLEEGRCRNGSTGGGKCLIIQFKGHWFKAKQTALIGHQ